MKAEAIPNGSDDAVPVAILGAGPAGLALANELSWRGIRCILIDRLTQPLDFPTSESIHARTMEHFRRWGIADGVRNAGFPLDMPRSVSFVTRLKGYDLGRVERPSNREQQRVSGAISPEGPIWCPKFLFEEVMRRRLRETGTTEFLSGHEVTHFTQDDTGVDISVRDLATGREFTLRSRFLAACDGASSGTRKALGIDFEGTFAEGRKIPVGSGVSTSLGFALFGSLFFSGDLGLRVLLALLLDGHYAGFLGSFRSVFRRGVDEFAIALLAVGVFGGG